MKAKFLLWVWLTCILLVIATAWLGGWLGERWAWACIVQGAMLLLVAVASLAALGILNGDAP